MSLSNDDQLHACIEYRLMNTMLNNPGKYNMSDEAFIKKINDNFKCSQQLFNIELKPGKFGMGLFATKDMSKGSLVTCYPSHMILSYGKVTGRTPLKYSKKDAKYMINNYGLSVKHNGVYVGDPNLKLDKQYLGHFVNDPCDFAATSNGSLMYFLDSMKNVNTYYIGDKIVAQRDIKKGEELFVTYGCNYWKRKGKERFATHGCDNWKRKGKK
jgi:SET domain-containing protein